jgi:hypothetical protein
MNLMHKKLLGYGISIDRYPTEKCYRGKPPVQLETWITADGSKAWQLWIHTSKTDVLLTVWGTGRALKALPTG